MDNEDRALTSDIADVNTAKIDSNRVAGKSLFAANNLQRKTADNMVRSEASIDEKPLRTEKTTELEESEEEDKETEVTPDEVETPAVETETETETEEDEV